MTNIPFFSLFKPNSLIPASKCPSRLAEGISVHMYGASPAPTRLCHDSRGHPEMGHQCVGVLWLLVMCPHREVPISLSSCPLKLPFPHSPPFFPEDLCPPGLCPQGCYSCHSRATDLASPEAAKGNILGKSLFSFQASRLLPTAPSPNSFSPCTCQVPSMAQSFCHMHNFCVLSRNYLP